MIKCLKNYDFYIYCGGASGLHLIEDFNLNLSTSTFVEKIETDSTASTRQKSQAGNYFDTYAKFNFDLDKRNQKFKTSEGYRSNYNIQIPIISDTNTLTNSYNYKIYSELFDILAEKLDYPDEMLLELREDVNNFISDIPDSEL